MLAKSAEVSLQRLARHVGNVRDVFAESISDRFSGVLLGRSVHGLTVSFEGPAELVGRSVPVAIEQASAFGLAGRLVASS
jgi:tRNA A37 methylthiotransferase MiaB